jgi:hypothetical protein
MSFSRLKRFVLSLFTLTLLLLGNKAHALSNVTATVDKNPAMINESILLTVIADDDIDRSALDTSALLNDFIVGQTSVSSQTSMINFKTSRTTKWQVILIARKAGEFIIPSLTIENQQSMPIAVTVVETRSNKTDIQADILITSELSSEQVYVQQLLTLTLKLHYAVELKSGNLTEPVLTGASVEKAGKDKQTESIINGKRYRVIEQTYAITPEQSGEFSLQAPVFSGEILQASQRRSSFLSFAQTKPVSVLGEELAISVRPIPENYPKDVQWLPTDILTLHQEWQSSDGQFIVGEPITRTITLTAAGLSKAQLPKLDMKSTRGLKVYPDQAELNATVNNGRLVSQKVQDFALVPSSAGDFTLPAMNVTWFNTITNTIEKAILPSQTITVEPGENIANSPSTISPPVNQVQQASSSLPELAVKASTSIKDADDTMKWLFLALWILTILAWCSHIFYLKKVGVQAKTTGREQLNSTSNHYLTLLAACKKNNAEQALQHMLPWLKQFLRSHYPEIKINNIAQAQSLIHDQKFATALNDLQQHLYGKSAINGAPSWQGIALLNAIETLHNQRKIKLHSTETLALNP